jgi:DNA-binding response OmpR family regulator
VLLKGASIQVLIVEDDRALGLFLQKCLMLEGHRVVLAGDGQTALEEAALHPPDLVVLDLGLPDCDGTEVLQAMRREHHGTAMLVVTGRGELEQRIRCFNLGADALLIKPFSLDELAALCNSLLRRYERFSDPLLRFGGLEMDRMERTVSYAGRTLDLTMTECKLLEVLLQNKGACSSREELLRTAWRSTPDLCTNIVDVYITYLRKKLATACPAGSCSPIETVRGKGYRVRSGTQEPRLQRPANHTAAPAGLLLADSAFVA